jgi:hypothetical protein
MQKRSEKGGKLGIAASTLIVFSGGVVSPAKALDCTNTVVRSIPWEWTISQTVGVLKNRVEFLIVNLGPIFHSKSDSGGFNGTITIGKNHNPGENCGLVGEIPSAANVIIRGVLSGIYANATLGGNIEGALIETYTRAQATATYIGNLPDFSEGTGDGDFTFLKQDIFQLGLGVHPYVGTLNGQTKYGLGFNIGGFGGFINLYALFSYNTSLTDPNPIHVEYLYPVSVPGPLPLMGVGAAFGFACRLRRLTRIRDRQSFKG